MESWIEKRGSGLTATSLLGTFLRKLGEVAWNVLVIAQWNCIRVVVTLSTDECG